MIRACIWEDKIKKFDLSVEERLKLENLTLKKWLLNLKKFSHLVDKTIFVKSKLMMINQFLKQTDSMKETITEECQLKNQNKEETLQEKEVFLILHLLPK